MPAKDHEQDIALLLPPGRRLARRARGRARSGVPSLQELRVPGRRSGRRNLAAQCAPSSREAARREPGGLRAPETVRIPRGPGRRTRGPRRRHSGSSARLRTSDLTGLAPRGETAPAPRTRPPTGTRVPRPLASPGPTWGLSRHRWNVREEDRENRCAACPRARSRGPGLRRAGARASPAEDPSQALGLGITEGWGGRSPLGSGLSGGAPFLTCFLISAARTALCSPCHAAVKTLCFCVEWTLQIRTSRGN